MRETLLMRQRRRHVRGTRTRGAPGCATASAGDDEARELPRFVWLCVHAIARRARATDRVGPRGAWAMTNMSFCVSCISITDFV